MSSIYNILLNLRVFNEGFKEKKTLKFSIKIQNEYISNIS